MSDSSTLFKLVAEAGLDIDRIKKHLYDADINFQDQNSGNTLLHTAAEKGYFSLIELLLMLGVKAGWRNHNDQLPSALAKEWQNSLPEAARSEHDETIKILEQAERNDARAEKKLEKIIHELFSPDIERILRLAEENHAKEVLIAQLQAVIKKLKEELEAANAKKRRAQPEEPESSPSPRRR